MTFIEGIKIVLEKSSSRDIGGYFFNIVIIVCSFVFILPNLSTDLSKYSYEVAQLKDTKLHPEKWTEGFKEKQETTLFLITDKNQWEISSEHSGSWEKLQEKDNIGKQIKLYCRNNTSNKYINPNQIEIDNKIIYSISEDMTWSYIFLGIVLFFTIYNINIIRFTLKYK
jgi:hypothetical protein